MNLNQLIKENTPEGNYFKRLYYLHPHCTQGQNGSHCLVRNEQIKQLRYPQAVHERTAR